MQHADYVQINDRTIASISRPQGTKIAHSQECLFDNELWAKHRAHALLWANPLSFYCSGFFKQCWAVGVLSSFVAPSDRS